MFLHLPIVLWSLSDGLQLWESLKSTKLELLIIWSFIKKFFQLLFCRINHYKFYIKLANINIEVREGVIAPETSNNFQEMG